MATSESTIIKKAIIIRPNFSQAYRSLAKIWYLVGELEKANFCRRQALNLESSQLNSASDEQLNSAHQLLEKVIPEAQTATVELTSVKDYQQLAQKLEKQNRWQEAAMYYRKALELNITELSSSLAFPETKQKHQFQKLEKPTAITAKKTLKRKQI